METKLFSFKNILIFLVLLIMIIAIPVAVELSKRQTQIKSQASGDGDVTFTGANVKQDTNGNFVSNSKDIQIKITSPFGPGSGN